MIEQLGTHINYKSWLAAEPSSWAELHNLIVQNQPPNFNLQILGRSTEFSYKTQNLEKCRFTPSKLSSEPFVILNFTAFLSTLKKSLQLSSSPSYFYHSNGISCLKENWLVIFLRLIELASGSC